MRVVLSEPAEFDLLEIAISIARHNRARARAFVRERRAAARQIGAMPNAFALVPGHEQRGIRRRPYRDYLIFYRVGTDRVVIMRIVHGARDYAALLARDPGP